MTHFDFGSKNELSLKRIIKEECIFLGRVNDLHTWQFPTDRLADRPADRPTDLDKLNSSDWLKVGMLYRRGGH